jgi:putative hemolysin
MISIERSFYRRFPRLAVGAGRSLSRPVVGLLRRIACEQRINEVLDRLQAARGFDFVEQALHYLRFDYRVAPSDRANIPSEGRVVIVANHPLGALDALALIHLVGSVRRDVRILANDVLTQIDALSPLLVPCDVFGRARRLGVREGFRALEREEALIVFPAGEVSRIHPTGVRDGTWAGGFARFARRTAAPIVPVHVAAHNSPTFYGVSLLAKPVATLMLPREMFAARDARVALTVGAPIAAHTLAASGLSDPQLAARMRRHVYQLGRRRPPVFATTASIAHPQPVQTVRNALRRAERLGQTSDGKQILLLDAQADDPALREIGRLRELAFRRVGEGSGASRDLDRFDTWYRHLVLWDEVELEIVGAYRLGEARTILPARGVDGLYSASLFDYGPGSQAFLPHSVELGRSFVHPRHWGSRSLDHLWQGIGAYLRQQPQVRYLIGPVSLSAQLPELARQWIVHAHAHYFGAPEGLARARLRYRASEPVALQAQACWHDRPWGEAEPILRDKLKSLGTTIPTLYRQYVELCELDGVSFLDFGVDPDFGHCVDGLIRLDLQRLRPAKRRRYLGENQFSLA